MIYLRESSRVLEHPEDRIPNLLLRMETQAELQEPRKKIDSKQVADLLQYPDRVTEDEEEVGKTDQRARAAGQAGPCQHRLAAGVQRQPQQPRLVSSQRLAIADNVKKDSDQQ